MFLKILFFVLGILIFHWKIEMRKLLINWGRCATMKLVNDIAFKELVI